MIRGPALAALALLVLLPVAARAAETPLTARGARLVDRPLVDAQGRRHRFLTDLIARGPVLLSFTFTGCRALCPPMDVIMDRVAGRLREGGGSPVRLATLTLDPLTDTPAHLRRERAEPFDPDRLFLTGAPDDVFAVLDGLGIEGGANQDHDSVVLLIEAGGRRVLASPPLPDPDELAAALARRR
ncbi:SCO family protein [uncultured Methylobacterium sp.]|uniref:SCO family protein n=1 Tax=uncultured Methylobacterium sp. TaxID=157278 RepID=UPI002634DA68|nr:SCO family protein [uncultured Methylobacterium sp.]